MATRGELLVIAAAVGIVVWASPVLPRAAGDGRAAAATPAGSHGPATTTTGSTGASPRFRFRYMFDSSSDPKLVAAHGWNLLDVGSKWDADRLPQGTSGLVWLGDYDNDKCAFSTPDSELKRELPPMADDPKVAGFFFSDEPNPRACPNAPAEHRARSSLIHTLSPGKPTVMVVDSNSDQASLAQIPLWVGAADYVGLNPYVCLRGQACDFRWVDRIIGAADKAGLSYWGVVQAFRDSEWRWPTPAEETRMLGQWSRSKAAGMMTFAWSWSGNSLRSRPDLLAVWRKFNASRRSTSAVAAVASAKPSTGTAREVHYTFTGPTSVAFSWRGTAAKIRYGLTKRYGRTATAHHPVPAPFSSAGPFWESQLVALKAGTRYHYSIGGGPDHTFGTSPIGRFRFDVEADVGDSGSWDEVGPTQRQIALDDPAFVLVAGDLTYGNDDGQSAVDRHFDDVMAWSQKAAYMPAWGNHEWDSPTDDLRNYKGRFVIPHAQRSAGAPTAGCCGEDWGWFDAGGVRFISYPEPYDDSTWPDWKAKAEPIFAAAQASPKIHFIVTFGHRPAYSTGYHDGEPTLASIIGAFGNRFSKYVVNFNGHSHDYERYRPIDHVVHITAAGGGSELETPWSGKDQRTAYRAMHLEHVRVDVTANALRIEAVCGPATDKDDISCPVGAVIDRVTIRRR